jgi:hypothetical protein
VVHVADLQLALSKADVTGQTVPAQWEGAQLTLHTSGIVIAEWSERALDDLILKSPPSGDETVLVQSLPLTLSVPSGFDFTAYSALVLRVLGVRPAEAQQMAERAGTAPAWLVPLALGCHEAEPGCNNLWAHATMEEIRLNSGLGTLVQESGDDGAVKRVTLLWSVPDRVYLLSGTLSRELMIATANAVQ